MPPVTAAPPLVKLCTCYHPVTKAATRRSLAASLPAVRLSTRNTSSFPLQRSSSSTTSSLAIRDGTVPPAKYEGSRKIPIRSIESRQTDASQSKIFVPWYLRNDNASTLPDSSNPRADRQRIPELPPQPPPILEDLLKHVSVTLGMEDLALLDLRQLDPPPALGANLIMVVGTARGEKHLHISADRLCRWLRGTHKLSPYGDGIVTRAKHKLDMSRRRRRMKLLSNTGASTPGPPEAPLTSGWVCVHVGKVDVAPEIANQETERPEGFVGFGQSTRTVSLVVQLLTEDKRGELDIEGLWNNVLERAANRIDKTTAALETSESSKPDEDWADAGSDDTNQADSRHGLIQKAEAFSTAVLKSPFQQQTKTFHSLSRPSAGEVATSPLSAGLSHNHLRVRLTRPCRRTFTTSSTTCINASELAEMMGRTEKTDVKRKSAFQPQHPSTWSSARLPNAARKSHVKTPFSLILNRDLDIETASSESPYASLDNSINTWNTQLRNCCQRARISWAGGEPEVELMALLSRILVSGVFIPRQYFEQILSALIIRAPPYFGEKPFLAPTQSFERAFLVLEWMEAFGHPVACPRVWTIFYDAVAKTVPKVDFQDRHVAQERRRQARDLLLKWLDLYAVELSEAQQLSILRDLLHEQKQDMTWHFWHSLPRRMLPRSEAMYEAMFAEAARSGDILRCAKVLRRCVPELDAESPPVRLGPALNRAVMECLLLVEPEVEHLATVFPAKKGEWPAMWLRCQSALPERYASPGRPALPEQSAPDGESTSAEQPTSAEP